MLSQIQKNEEDINTEVNRAMAAEEQLGNDITSQADRVTELEIQFEESVNEVKTQAARVDGNAFTATANEVKLTTTGVDTSKNHTVTLPTATETKAGIMSAEDKKKLDNINSDGGDITAEETDDVISNIEENVVANALRKTSQVLTESEKLQARENIDAQKELTLTIKDNGNIVIGNIQGETKEFMPATPSGDPMHYAYIAAGAKYNDSGADITKTAPWGETVTHKAGHYYLNGLGDITKEEMVNIYNYRDVVYRLNMPRLAQNIGVRTFYPVNTPINNIAQYLINNKLSGYATFFNANKLEVLLITPTSIDGTGDTLLPATGMLSNVFGNCSSLKYLCGINCKNITGFDKTFDGCSSLIEARLFNVVTNVSFKDSQNISKKSILYIIQNAAPTSAITITLHHDAYVRLTSDQEILDALTEKNAALLAENKGGKVSLVCATHSEEIIPKS